MFVNSAILCRVWWTKLYAALNGKDLANSYLERKGLPIGWTSISPAFLDRDFQCCQQCQTAGASGMQALNQLEITF